MKLFVAGLSYKTAPVSIRERVAVPAGRLQCYGCRLKLRGGLSEVVLVSTCNRVEIYGVAPVVNGRVERLFQELAGSDIDFSPYLYVKEGVEAAKHLFSVVSGLDSMVIGETEITGQTSLSVGPGSPAHRPFNQPAIPNRAANGQGNSHPNRHRPWLNLGWKCRRRTGGEDF